MNFIVAILLLILGYAAGFVKAYGYDEYGYDDHPSRSIALQPNACALTVCGKLPYFDQCTPDWYAALNACMSPPCNIRYARNPAQACKGETVAAPGAVEPTKTSVDAVPTSVPTAGFRPIPLCGLSCFGEAIANNGCQFSDTACHCTKKAAFQESYEKCVVWECSPDDQKLYAEVLLEGCSALGVPGVFVPATPARSGPKLHSRTTPTDIPFPEIPDCSKGCFGWSVLDSCSTSDAACHCTKVSESANRACVRESCGIRDRQRYRRLFLEQCEGLGIAVNITAESIDTEPPRPEVTDLAVQVAHDLSSLINSLSSVVVSAVSSCIHGDHGNGTLVSNATLPRTAADNNTVPFVTATSLPSKASDAYSLTTVPPVFVAEPVADGALSQSLSTNGTDAAAFTTLAPYNATGGAVAMPPRGTVLVAPAIAALVGWLLFAA